MISTFYNLRLIVLILSSHQWLRISSHNSHLTLGSTVLLKLRTKVYKAHDNGL